MRVSFCLLTLPPPLPELIHNRWSLSSHLESTRQTVLLVQNSSVPPTLAKIQHQITVPHLHSMNLLILLALTSGMWAKVIVYQLQAEELRGTVFLYASPDPQPSPMREASLSSHCPFSLGSGIKKQQT